MSTTQINDTMGQAQREYQNALQKAFWRKARTWLGRGCNDLLSFPEVYEHLKDRSQYQRGLRQVPLSQIVGSTGRYGDFDLVYYPVRDATENRWANVARRWKQSARSMPVLLYKVGNAYFVEDGNHRVSVASVNGESHIEAKVIEIDVSNLTPEPSCTRLGYKLK
ncbi:MAG TPA: hypothetical protein VJ972_01270 [Anaerolineales bacterium]|nr:hypothetical protein [Anaerolineales bacterium]